MCVSINYATDTLHRPTSQHTTYDEEREREKVCLCVKAVRYRPLQCNVTSLAEQVLEKCGKHWNYDWTRLRGEGYGLTGRVDTALHGMDRAGLLGYIPYLSAAHTRACRRERHAQDRNTHRLGTFLLVGLTCECRNPLRSDGTAHVCCMHPMDGNELYIASSDSRIIRRRRE